MQGADLVFLILENGAVIEDVLFAQGVAAAAKPGAILVDMSSIAPGTSQKIAAACEAQGVSFLDAPVSGGEPIGTLQAGPSHCPPRSCLHWGWLEGTTYLDPLSLVGQGPVRLLPFLAEPPQTGGSSRPGPPVPSWW